MKTFLISGNRAVFPDILFLVLSLARSQNDPLFLTIVSGDFANIDPRYEGLKDQERIFLEQLLQKQNPESRVVLKDVSEQALHDFPYLKNANKRYTPYAYLRLYAEVLIPGDEPILYLDSDTVVLQDLTPLFASELGQADIGLVKDPLASRFHHKIYGNSGVLLINTPIIRKDQAFQNALALIAKHRHGYFDQEAINHCCTKVFLPQIYNEENQLSPATVIRHYPRFYKIFPYPHDQVIRPSNPQAFRKCYPGVHEALLQEFETLLKEYQAR
jgi:hypothetical protein